LLSKAAVVVSEDSIRVAFDRTVLGAGNTTIAKKKLIDDISLKEDTIK